MNTFDELRKTFETKVNQLSAALNFQVIFDDDDMPKGERVTFVHFWYETNPSVKKEAANGRKAWECTSGVLNFNIYAPEKSASAPMTILGDQIKKKMNSIQFLVPPEGYVKLDVMSVQRTPIKHNGRKVVICRATFDFTHRDASADAF